MYAMTTQVVAWIQLNADWFAGILLRVTIVLLSAAFACRAWRRSSAAVRHQIWVLALAATLLVPAITLMAPPRELEWLPANAQSLTLNSAPTTIQAPTGEPVLDQVNRRADASEAGGAIPIQSLEPQVAPPEMRLLVFSPQLRKGVILIVKRICLLGREGSVGLRLLDSTKEI